MNVYRLAVRIYSNIGTDSVHIHREPRLWHGGLDLGWDCCCISGARICVTSGKFEVQTWSDPHHSPSESHPDPLFCLFGWAVGHNPLVDRSSKCESASIVPKARQPADFRHLLLLRGAILVASDWKLPTGWFRSRAQWLQINTSSALLQHCSSLIATWPGGRHRESKGHWHPVFCPSWCGHWSGATQLIPRVLHGLHILPRASPSWLSAKTKLHLRWINSRCFLFHSGKKGKCCT